MAGEYQSKWTGAEIDEGITKAYNSAPKENGIYYIEGNSSTNGVWLGNHDDITEYYNGLMIAYKINKAGVSDGTTLNINSLGAVPVVRNATTAVTTTYAVNSVVFLTYTVDSGTAYWKTADYDANSYAYVRQYYTTTNANYPLIFKYDSGLTTTTNYVTKYTRTANNLYVNPSTGALYAKELYRDGSKVATVDDITTLTNRIAALETALANKQDKISDWADLKG